MKMQSFFACAMIALCSVCGDAVGQIVAYPPLGANSVVGGVDGVLSAPYRGTAQALKAISDDLPYGEVWNHCEPATQLIVLADDASGGGTDIEISTLDGNWDRSMLRLYAGLDASGGEIDLTGRDSTNPLVFRAASGLQIQRFSFKAIGTNTLARVRFRVNFHYHAFRPSNGTPSEPNSQLPIFVAPISGSNLGIRDESLLYMRGAELLRISIGAAQLVIPAGVTADMIGECFEARDNKLGPDVAGVSAIKRTDVVLPGSAESTSIPFDLQFQIGDDPALDGPAKTTFATPWAAYMRGYFNSNGTIGPDGTRYDDVDANGNPISCDSPIFSTCPSSTYGMRPYRRCFPRQLTSDAGIVDYVRTSIVGYDRVTKIQDHASSANWIMLTRDDGMSGTVVPGAVTGITTSDGRHWNILSDMATGWITGIEPGDRAQVGGARYYSHSTNTTDPKDSRISEVRTSPTPGAGVLYQFTYDSSGDLLTEKRPLGVSGAMVTVVQHDRTSSTLHRRKEFVESGQFRQTDFAYANATSSPPLAHRLSGVTTFRGLNGSGTSFTTTYTHDVSNAFGNMTVTRADLPDGSHIDYLYDAPLMGTSRQFGMLTKATRVSPVVAEGSLVLLDREYDFFHASGSKLYSLPRVTKVRDGLGRPTTYAYELGGTTGADGLLGEQSNDLQQITGPAIDSPIPGTRAVAKTVFQYDSRRLPSLAQVFHTSSLSRDTKYEYDGARRVKKVTQDPTGLNLATEYRYNDGLANQEVKVFDPEKFFTVKTFTFDGRPLSTRRFLDPGASADATPSGKFYTTSFGYETLLGRGWLETVTVENKDQFGDPIPQSPAAFVTKFEHDLIGRVIKSIGDSDANTTTHVNRVREFAHNWQDDLTTELDTSGRGVMFDYEGRGLMAQQAPLRENSTLASPLMDINLVVTNTYDPMGNLVKATRPSNDTNPDGTFTTFQYDSFDRLKASSRKNTDTDVLALSTNYEYDGNSNVTRVFVTEGPATVRSDHANKFDEDSLCYESRTRATQGTVIAGIDNDNTDLITKRTFDSSGLVKEVRQLGDTTVVDPTNTGQVDAVFTTDYDLAGRTLFVADNIGGRTDLVHTKRGQVKQRLTRINDIGQAAIVASTDIVFDALGRPIDVMYPEHENEVQNCSRAMRYDSRGNLLNESLVVNGPGATPTQNPSERLAKLTRVMQYDGMGELTASAILETPDIASNGTTLSNTNDRVTRIVPDRDGRTRTVSTFNSNSATANNTTYDYDTHGRLMKVTNAAGEKVEYEYHPDDVQAGLLKEKKVTDGVGLHTYTFGYDGYDRQTSITSVGTGGDPSLTSSVQFDALDRVFKAFDPKGTGSTTLYDFAGRLSSITEADSVTLPPPFAPISRETVFEFNRLNFLIKRTPKNTGDVAQPTHMRYDPLGRLIRTVYPDSADAGAAATNFAGCADCVKRTYDVAGRERTVVDQRAVTRTMTYDDRGNLILLASTQGDGANDSFDHDELGRLMLAERSRPNVAATDAGAFFARSKFDYTTRGDLKFEEQAITGKVNAGAMTPAHVHTAEFTFDQGGNRTSLTYPGGQSLHYAYTALDLPSTVRYGSAAGGILLDQRYAPQSAASAGGIPGSLPSARVVFPTPGAATISYARSIGYNSARQVKSVSNTLGTVNDLASLQYALDANNNALTQTPAGVAGFALGARTSEVDALNRLTTTTYPSGGGGTETTTVDKAGNPLSFTGRAGTVRTSALGPTTPAPVPSGLANEYATVNGKSVAYDAAGNLMTDEDGRGYSYDEHNRLTKVTSASGGTLAVYTYDALGRRVSARVAGSQERGASGAVSVLRTRLFYVDALDSDNVLEERGNYQDTLTASGASTDVRLRWHVNGLVGVDERVASYEGEPGPASSSDDNRFYLLDRTDTPLGWTDGLGTSVGLGGGVTLADLSPRGQGGGRLKNDAEGDGDIDLLDFASLQRAAGRTVFPNGQAGLGTHDTNGDSAINSTDGTALTSCMQGPGKPVSAACATPPGHTADPSFIPPIPKTGDFGLHGRMIDVLADGKVLIYWRARWYDPANGRFLQRDPAGYVDGPGLYEAFGSNPGSFLDPSGMTIRDEYSTMAQGIAAAKAEAAARGQPFVLFPPTGPAIRDHFANVGPGASEALYRLFGSASADHARSVMAIQNARGSGVTSAIRRRDFSRAAQMQASINSDVALMQDFEAVQMDLAVQAAGMATAAVPVTSIAGAAGSTGVGTTVNAAGTKAVTAFMNTGPVQTIQRTAQWTAMSAAIEVGASNLPRVTVGEGAAAATSRAVPALVRTAAPTVAAQIVARRAASLTVGQLGTAGEVAAESHFRSQGYSYLSLQYNFGSSPVSRGIDGLAYRVGASGAIDDVVLVEVKNYLRPMSAQEFTALGGRNADQFTKNLGRAEGIIHGSGIDKEIAGTLVDTLRAGGGRIVLFGPRGLGLRTGAQQTLENITGRPVQVINDPVLLP